MWKKLGFMVVFSLVAGLWGAKASAVEEGMTVLITGANRGIGLELAKQLKDSGYSVIGTARKPDKASELNALGVKVVQLDVTDKASVAAMAASLDGAPIDLLINNAGIGGHMAASFAETDFEQIGWTFDVNSIGPMRVTQALLPNVMASKAKRVVHISSNMGSIANNSGGYYGYRASKSALNMLNSSLAMELESDGVTCVVLHPGWVKTDLGGENAAITTEVSVAGMLKVIDGLSIENTGHFYDYQGEELPW